MVTVVRIHGFKIQVYADDHYPPHFHIVAPDFEVLVTISGLSILKGKHHARDVIAALEWAREHEDHLLAVWTSLNER